MVFYQGGFCHWQGLSGWDIFNNYRIGRYGLIILGYNWYDYLLVGLASLAAGVVNALAGGGTLITFPMLTAIGVPAVAANITNTIALSPGHLGATYAQLDGLIAQKKKAWLYLPISVLGGILGGFLLLRTGEKLFRELVPFLILLACGLLAVSDRLRTWLVARMEKHAPNAPMAAWGILPVGLAAIYGGYFGAGMSVIVLAVLGLISADSLTHLNALKQAIAFCVNVSAAVYFLFSGQIVWPLAIFMAACALLGGTLGGRLARQIKPSMLRWVVVVIGVVIAIIYLVN